MKQPIFNLRAILSGIALAAVLVACGDEEVTITPIVTPPTPEKTDPISSEDHLVYVAMGERINEIWVPKIIMPDGSILPLTDGKHDGEGSAIYVDDQKNTYVAGSLTSSTRAHYAVYWKNTVPVLLTDTLKDAGAFTTDIVVSGGDVYVSGWVGATAVYWKNGVRVDLSDGKSAATALSIFVSGNDVYVTGAVKNISTDKYEACYWKNGTKIKLPPSLETGNQTTGNAATDIMVSGDDLYITGSFGKGKYWKNGSLVTLEAKEGGTGHILFSNGSVYITGVGRYWKDNVPVNMLSETSRPNLYSIAVLDDVVYLSGFESLGGFNTPRIWKNGVATTLNDGKHHGSAYVFVVRK